MSTCCFFDRIGRKTIVTGHYGSGKTEFSVSLAMHIAVGSKRPYRENDKSYDSYALIDLDIVNPYFRSRERRELLQKSGITVFGSVYKEEVTLELPALGASLRAPLEDSSCRVIIDTGGNDTGALILNQFTKYFKDEETKVLAVVNANRPDTSDIKSAIEHISAIEHSTALVVTGIVNNMHLLRETTVDDIIRGHEFCDKICQATGKPVICDCYPEDLVNPDELSGLSENLMPLGLYMRPKWLDK